MKRKELKFSQKIKSFKNIIKKFLVFLILVIIFTFSIIAGLSNDNTSSIKSGSINHNGLNRTFLFYLPTSYKIKNQIPLIIALHGGGGSGQKMIKLTRGGFNLLAEKEGFIVVYPDGIKNHWNDSRKDMTLEDVENIDDVGFMSSLIDYFIEKFGVDPNKIYVTGVSNGAMMSYRLAIELSNKISAIAAVAGNLPFDQINLNPPKKAIPILIINGTDDPIMPYNGGYINRQKERGKVLSTFETVKYWVKLNNCNPSADISYLPDTDIKDGTRVRKEVYLNDSNIPMVVLYAIEGGGHTWPGGLGYFPEKIIGKTCNDIDANKEIWSFFQNFFQ